MRDEFFPQNPAKTAALVYQDKDQYKQGRRSLDNYIDSFQAFIEQANYPNSLQLCLTFQEGLTPALMECMDNLAKGRPSDNQVDSWYQVAQDQWQLIELEHDFHHAAAPTPAARPPIPAQRFCVPTVEPLLAGPPVHPPVCPMLPPGVPMDVNASCQHAALPLLCQCCRAPSHFARRCPLCLEVQFLAPEEQEGLLLQLLAAWDSAGIPSPNANTSDSHKEKAPSIPADMEVPKEDF
ncbi:hypothetical protein C0992_013225 [Termitomyces sp. T32_za158]|nr:hypothetical protein C0992_013225 [Termitomyces sp. T32_za158]